MPIYNQNLSINEQNVYYEHWYKVLKIFQITLFLF